MLTNPSVQLDGISINNKNHKRDDKSRKIIGKNEGITILKSTTANIDTTNSSSVGEKKKSNRKSRNRRGKSKSEYGMKKSGESSENGTVSG